MKQATVFPILLFCIAAFIAGVEHAEAQGSVDTDREALVALYDSTNGDDWRYNTNWKSNKPLDEWYRVDTNSEGRVIFINLFDNNLTGSIPSELGNLTNLQILQMSDNKLTGSLPSELGNLTNLQALKMSDNNLTGPIPPELGNLANLELLYLRYNNLTGSISPELGNLANLQVLALANNKLTGSIPSELGNLVNLKELHLGYNKLTGSIPPELGNLANLKELYLDDNNLIGSLPPTVCSLFFKGIKFGISGNIGLVIDCFKIPDELSNNERRHFTFDNQDVEFILLQENQYAIIWISTETFNSINISFEEIQELLDYVSISTPTDPTKGYLEYSRDLLGTVLKNPRNGERKIDIFFHLLSGPSFASRHKNYIDFSGFNNYLDPVHRTRDFGGTISHEYVHSINLAYAWYNAFLVEGLAEWVVGDIIPDEINMIFNNPPSSPFVYRDKPLFQPRPLAYSQGRIFIAYLADRIGIENMKHLIQVCKPGGICDVDNPDNGDWYHGIDGIDSALSLINPDLTLENIVIDYHTTNLVNDSSVVLNGIKYGYKSIKYGDKRFKIPPDIIVDFRSNSFFQKTIELKPGGVDYIAYENTSDLHFAIDTSNKELTLLRLFKEKGDTKELVDIDRNVDEYMVSGDYDRVTLITVHANPKPDQTDIALTISATQNYGVSNESDELPTVFSLEQNYPNPFNPSTSIGWSQPQAAQVRLSVYNMLGQEVATLVDDFRPAGVHEVRLDALNWTSGVYVYVLEAGEKTFTQRMVLLK